MVIDTSNNKYCTLCVRCNKYLYSLFTVPDYSCSASYSVLLSVFTDKYYVLHIIKITVTVTPCDINPVNFLSVVSQTHRGGNRLLKV